ncbi:MAG: hypothetical protein JO316_05765 [Abitibacteriaceae bacterium]|nr:hypothetical protein [Abditibacteriaceae bacterium]
MSTVSLGTKLVQAVQKEAAMQRPLPLQATAEVSVSGSGRHESLVTASVTLTDHDRFSHLVEGVQVEITPTKPATSRSGSKLDTQDKAQCFAQRATYLTEALQFVEKDAGGSAILRSSPQTMRAPRAEYFEAQVSDTSIALKRYQPRAAKPGRAPVTFCLTDEVLARLADDAAAALTPPAKK